MLNKRVKLVIAGLVAVFMLSYFITQLVLISKSGIETQIAMSETVYSTINTKCFVVRNEQYIENSAKGTTISFAANAQRVAKGDTVSMVFKTNEDATTYLRITEIKEELEPAYTDKFGDKYVGYDFVRTDPTTIPDVINHNSTIKVYYEIKDYLSRKHYLLMLFFLLYY